MTEEKLPAELVKGPAIGLMVTGGLGIGLGLLNILMTLAGAGGVNEAQLEQMPEEWADAMRALSSTGGGIVFGLIGLALNGFVLYGGLQMKNLRSRGMAVAASIVALVPCLICCLLGWPFGIWSLVVLNKPEVKQAFS